MTRTERHHLWQQTLAEWTASGLSGAAFCTQQSLSYSRFVYLRRKFRRTGEVASPAGFARVTPTADVDTAEGLTVSLPGGVSVTGLHAGNIELLGAVLRQL